MKKYYFLVILIGLVNNNSLLSMLSATILKKHSKNFFKQKKNKRFNHNHHYQDQDVQKPEKTSFFDKYAGIILGGYVGFFGLALSQDIKRKDNKVTTVDQTNYEQRKEIEELKNNNNEKKQRTWYEPLVIWVYLHKD